MAESNPTGFMAENEQQISARFYKEILYWGFAGHKLSNEPSSDAYGSIVSAIAAGGNGFESAVENAAGLSVEGKTFLLSNKGSLLLFYKATKIQGPTKYLIETCLQNKNSADLFEKRAGDFITLTSKMREMTWAALECMSMDRHVTGLYSSSGGGGKIQSRVSTLLDNDPSLISYVVKGAEKGIDFRKTITMQSTITAQDFEGVFKKAGVTVTAADRKAVASQGATGKSIASKLATN